MVAHSIAARDVSDALLIKLGAPLVEFDDGKVVTGYNGRPKMRQASRYAIELSAERLADIGGVYLSQVGGVKLAHEMRSTPYPARVRLMMSRSMLSRYFPRINAANKYVSLATSTGDFPGLLADTLNKAVLSHYAVARRSWRAWARQGEVDNFQEASRVRLDDAAGLIARPEGAEIEYATLPETTERFMLGSYARGFQITREAVLNDDAGAFGNITQIMAAAAHRLEDSLAYAVLTGNDNMSDGSPLFSTAHGNMATGVLNAANLSAATALIAKQKNTNGDILDMQAARLIVPASLKATAEAVLHSLSGANRGVGETDMSVVSSALLEDDSATQWFVSTSPEAAAPVEVAFLRGASGPRVDSKSNFTTDGINFKVVHDVCAKAIDHRTIVRSSGE